MKHLCKFFFSRSSYTFLADSVYMTTKMLSVAALQLCVFLFLFSSLLHFFFFLYFIYLANTTYERSLHMCKIRRKLTSSFLNSTFHGHINVTNTKLVLRGAKHNSLAYYRVLTFSELLSNFSPCPFSWSHKYSIKTPLHQPYTQYTK